MIGSVFFPQSSKKFVYSRRNSKIRRALKAYNNKKLLNRSTTQFFLKIMSIDNHENF